MLFINMVNFFVRPDWNLRRMRARIFVFLSCRMLQSRVWDTDEA